MSNKRSEGPRKVETIIYFSKLPRGGCFKGLEAVIKVQWSWTHLGLIDDQTHECGHQHGPGQRRSLAPQVRFVHGESGRFLRHRHSIGVTQRRHGSQCCPTPGCGLSKIPPMDRVDGSSECEVCCPDAFAGLHCPAPVHSLSVEKSTGGVSFYCGL